MMTIWKGMSFVFAVMLGSVIMMVAQPQAKQAQGPDVTYFKLENGLDVVVIPDRRAPVATHMVWYRVGAADELPRVSGIAHFLEHLMFKGTDKIPPGEFSKIVARHGGEDNAFTSQDVTAYFQRVAKENLPLVMEMEADRMSNLKLLEKDVLTERDVILEERRSRVENSPSSLLSEQIAAGLYLSHPYGIPVIGWMHEIAELSRQNALDHYRKYYVPNNAILVVAGDVSADEVRVLAEKFYGPVKRGADLKTRKRALEPVPVAPRRVVLEDPRAGKLSWQRHYLVPSFTTAPPGDSEALELFMKVVVEGTTSRLYRKMVIDEKLASSAGGGYSPSGLDYGRQYIYAVPAKGVSVEKIEASVDRVLSDALENGITELELERARNAYIADYIYNNDSQTGLARRYGFSLATGWSIEDIESYPERLKKVTVDDLKRVGARYLNINATVTGVLVPAPRKTAKLKDPAN